MQKAIINDQRKMEKKNNYLQRCILIFLSGIIILASYFFSFTNGFLTNVSTKDYLDFARNYCDQVANEDVVIEVGKYLFGGLLCFEFLFIRKHIMFFEIIMYLFIGIIQEIIAFLPKLDGCSIIKTIIFDNNYRLFFFLFFLSSFNIFII